MIYKECGGQLQLSSALRSMGEILNPLALLQHECTQRAFDQLEAMAGCIQGKNGTGGEAAQAEGAGNTDAPNKATVEIALLIGLPWWLRW